MLNILVLSGQYSFLSNFFKVYLTFIIAPTPNLTSRKEVPNFNEAIDLVGNLLNDLRLKGLVLNKYEHLCWLSRPSVKVR